MARPEELVLHTHSIAGCALSMQKHGLLPLNQHGAGDVAYHDYEGAARSPEERARFLADLGYFLPYHGAAQSRPVGLSDGASPGPLSRPIAWSGLRDAVRLPAIGAPVSSDSADVSAAYDNAYIFRLTGGRNDPAKFEWPALLPKLDHDPSYKR